MICTFSLSARLTGGCKMILSPSLMPLRAILISTVHRRPAGGRRPDWVYRPRSAKYGFTVAGHRRSAPPCRGSVVGHYGYADDGLDARAHSKGAGLRHVNPTRITLLRTSENIEVPLVASAVIRLPTSPLRSVTTPSNGATTGWWVFWL